MKKKTVLLVILTSCFLLNGCLDFILTVNRIVIPDTVEGVWEIDNERFEVRKKDDYWANVKPLKKGDKEETLGMTFHKINGSLFACFTGWNRGEKVGFVMPIEIVNDKKVHFYQFEMSEEDQATMLFDFTKPKEKTFLSLLKKGKITIDTSKPNTLNKVSTLED